MNFHGLPEPFEWWAEVSAGLALPWPTAAAEYDAQWFYALLLQQEKSWGWTDDVKVWPRRDAPTNAALARRWGWPRKRVVALLGRLCAERQRGQPVNAPPPLVLTAFRVEGFQ